MGKSTVNFFMSVCLSVCLSVILRRTTETPLDGFSWNLTFQFFKNLSCNSLKSENNNGWKVKVKVSRDRPRWPKGFWVDRAPDFLTIRHYKAGMSSAKRTGRLYPRRNPWYSLSGAESTSGHMVLLGYHGKNPQWHYGNRSQDLPTISAVP